MATKIALSLTKPKFDNNKLYYFFEKNKWLVWIGFLFTNDSNKFTGKETNRRNMDTKNWKQSFRFRCLPRFFPLWNKRIYQWIRRAFAMTTHSKQYIGFIFSGKCSSPRDMVMWSKSSMYLYCGAYLFTASHHILEGNVPIIFPCVCIFLFCL